MKPTLLFKHGHSYWVTDKGIAVADQSIRVWGAPGSTDDGWLFLDEQRLCDSEEYYQVVGAVRPVICFRSCCSQGVPLEGGFSAPASADEFVALCQAIHQKRKECVV